MKFIKILLSIALTILIFVVSNFIGFCISRGIEVELNLFTETILGLIVLFLFATTFELVYNSIA